MARSTSRKVSLTNVSTTEIKTVTDSDIAYIKDTGRKASEFFEDTTSESNDIYNNFIDETYCPADEGETKKDKLTRVPYKWGQWRNYGGVEVGDGIPEIYWNNVVTSSNGECIPSGDLLTFFVENNLYPEINITPNQVRLETEINSSAINNFNLAGSTSSSYYRDNTTPIYNSNLATKVGIDYPDGAGDLPEFEVKVTPRLKDIGVSLPSSGPSACPVGYGFLDQAAMGSYLVALGALAGKVIGITLQQAPALPWAEVVVSLGTVTSGELFSGVQIPCFSSSTQAASTINGVDGLTLSNIFTISPELAVALGYLQGVSAFIGLIMFSDAIWDAVNQPATIIDYPYQYQNMIYGIYTFEDIAQSSYKIGAGNANQFNRNVETKNIEETGTTHTYTLNTPNWGDAYNQETNNIALFPNRDSAWDKWLNFEFYPRAFQYEYNTPPPIIEYVVELVPIRNCVLSTTKITKFVVSIAPDLYLAPNFNIITSSTGNELYTNSTITFKNARFADFLYLQDATNRNDSGIFQDLFGTYWNVTINSDGNEKYQRNRTSVEVGNDITMSGEEIFAVDVLGSNYYPPEDNYTVNFMLEAQPNIIYNPFFRVEKTTLYNNLKKFWAYNEFVSIEKGKAQCTGGIGILYQTIGIPSTPSDSSFYILTIQCSGQVEMHTDGYIFEPYVYSWDALGSDRTALTQEDMDTGFEGVIIPVPATSRIVYNGTKLQFNSGYYKVIVKRKNILGTPTNAQVYFTMPSGSYITKCKLQYLPNAEAGKTSRGCYNAITRYNQLPKTFRWKDGSLTRKEIKIDYNGSSPNTFTINLGLPGTNITKIEAVWKEGSFTDTDEYLLTNETSLVITKNDGRYYTECRLLVYFDNITINTTLTSLQINDNRVTWLYDTFGLLADSDIDLSGCSNLGGLDRTEGRRTIVNWGFDDITFRIGSLNVSNTNVYSNTSNITSITDYLNVDNTYVEGSLAAILSIPEISVVNTRIVDVGSGQPNYASGTEPSIIWKNSKTPIPVDQLNLLVYKLDETQTENGYLDIAGDNPEITDLAAIGYINNLIGKGWTVEYNIMDIPVITLVGGNPQTIEVGNPYIELGATAEDGNGNDITEDIIIDSSGVDINTIGSYEVTYNVTDGYGLSAEEVVRIVNIEEVMVDEVVIGTQTWRTKNLDIDDLGGGIYAYDNNEENVSTYGRLYTYSAAVRIVASIAGWHLPTPAELNTLENYLSETYGFTNMGGSMKSIDLWQSPNTGATNLTGFTGLPSGQRDMSGNFVQMGTHFYGMTSVLPSPETANQYLVYNSGSFITGYGGDSTVAYAVRLIKD
jgi:uncharacterized protein (TIGR02145 family)